MDLAAAVAVFIFFFIVGGLMALWIRLEEKYRRYLLVRRLFKTARERLEAEKRLSRAAMNRLLESLGRPVMPRSEAELIGIRRRLSYAGYRSGNAAVRYFGIRVGAGLVAGALYLSGLMMAGALNPRSLLMVFLPLALGYYLPAFLLSLHISSRQRQIFRELPDTLDLILICLEAGVGFDAALERVSREIAGVSSVLSEELARYFSEIRGGLSRKQALARLADRNGVPALTSVVNVLIQSARFGTDIAETLRVYIRSMRTERRQESEEKAAKISTKLTFPMVMLILPALFLIILGPAVINIFEQIQKGGGF